MHCPLAGYKVDEKGARIVGALTFSLALSLPILPRALQAAAILLLIGDFAPRALSRPQFSVFSRLARTLLSRLSIAPHPTDAGPKRFAARMGLGMLVAMLACSLAGAVVALKVLIVMLAGCAFLESALGFCVGCWMWSRYWELRSRLAVRAG